MQLRRSSDLEITNRAHAPLLLLLLSLMLAVLTSISALEETGGHKFKRGLEATAVLLHFKSSWCHWSHWPYVGALLGTAHALNLVVREVGMTGVGDLRGGTCGGHIQASDTRVCLLFLLWLAAIGVCLWCVFKWVSHRMYLSWQCSTCVLVALNLLLSRASAEHPEHSAPMLCEGAVGIVCCLLPCPHSPTPSHLDPSPPPTPTHPPQSLAEYPPSPRPETSCSSSSPCPPNNSVVINSNAHSPPLSPYSAAPPA